jgi:hypothetical protein
MMGEFETLGDAVAGSLLGRGEAVDGHTHEKSCLNCGTSLTGPYCAQCGQKAHVHRSVRGFLQDFLQGLFNFEGKFWHTLPMLAWRPGEMTRRYIAGERVRFISPVALYLFTVFAMFAALNVTGTLNLPGGKHFQDSLRSAIAQNQAGLAKLEVQRNAAAAAGQDVADLDRKIASRKQDIAGEQNVLNGKVFTKGDAGDDTPSWIEPFIENAVKDPQAASAKVQDAASKYSWLLIPISVPFLWLLFPFSRRYKIYDHAIFVTYSLSFMMMLVMTGSLLITAGFATLASLLFFVPPIHIYRQLKGAYALSWAGALWRATLLTLFANVAIGLFAALLVTIGALS